MKKYLTLTNEMQVSDQTIKRDYQFIVDVSEELFEDLNNLVFKKNPDALYKCKFEDYGNCGEENVWACQEITIDPNKQIEELVEMVYPESNK
jgi:hypothetical protein